jgi:putative ABC transport system substrate-binding protein
LQADIASLARPGGNATGISLMSPDLDGKRQDILIEAVPGAQRIAALADSNVASLEHLKALETSARNHGKELLVVRAGNANDLAPAINDARNRGAAALNVLSSPMLHLNRRLIIARAAEARLPAIYQWPENGGGRWPARIRPELYRYFPAARRNRRQGAPRRQTR